MILFISNSGESLPIAHRIQQAGHEVAVYLHNPKYRDNFGDLVKRLTPAKLPGAVRRAEAVVFDILRPNEGTHADKQLLKVFRANQKAPEVFGAVAAKIRNKVLTIGASPETATWELDRDKGTAIAKEVGIQIPETHNFTTLSDGAAFLKGKTGRWVFKPHNNQDLDLTYMESYPGELKSKLEGEYKARLGNRFGFLLQQVVEGVEISTEGWFDGKRFTAFNHTLEDKKLMNGNLGPAIGSQGNTVWVKRDPHGLLVQELGKLAPKLRAAGYIGPIDVNCIVAEADHKPHFLEWTCRQGYDALFCLLTLLQGGIADWYLRRFQAPLASGFASSQRITIPPFPYAEPNLLSEYAQGVALENGLDLDHFWPQDVRQRDGQLECAGADGIIGITAAKGGSVGESVGTMYRSINKLRVASTLQYRTDGGRRAEKDRKQLHKWGVNID